MLTGGCESSGGLSSSICIWSNTSAGKGPNDAEEVSAHVLYIAFACSCQKGAQRARLMGRRRGLPLTVLIGSNQSAMADLGEGNLLEVGRYFQPGPNSGVPK